MALFKSPIVSDASGSIGGATFSKNKGGLYMRARVKGTQPNTTAQTDARNRLKAITQAWATLTQAERDAWIAAAQSSTYQNALGDTKHLTGSQLFTKLNGSARAANPSASLITSPPSTLYATQMTLEEFIATSVSGFLNVDLGVQGDPDDQEICQVYIARNISAGVANVKKSKFKKVGELYGTGSINGAAISTLIAELSLPASIGSRCSIFLKVTNVATGAVAISNTATDIVESGA